MKDLSKGQQIKHLKKEMVELQIALRRYISGVQAEVVALREENARLKLEASK